MNYLSAVYGSGQTNLQYLKSCELGSSFLTDYAQRVFKDSQALNVGVGHYAKKYAAGTVVFVGTIALPVAVASGIFYCSLPSTKMGWLSFGASGLTAGATNQGISKLTGINIGSKLITLVSMALVTGAALASSSMMGSYTKLEEEIESAQKSARVSIIASLKETYNEMAQALRDNIQATENPRELSFLKKEAEAFERQLPEIYTQFAKIGLNGLESSNILEEFSSALKEIQGISLTLSAEKGLESFNFELMTMEESPLDQSTTGLIPPSIHHLVEQARDHQLGLLHRVRQYVNPALAGVAISASAIMGGLKVQEMFSNSKNPFTEGLITTSIAGTSLCAGVGAVYKLFKSYQNERVVKDTIVKKNYAAAKEQLKVVYKGLAESLAACHRGKEEKKEALKSKLPAIERQITNLRIPGLETQEILAPLYSVINQT